MTGERPSPERRPLHNLPVSPKKAGEQITCLKCGGKGYTAEGWARDYPMECNRCQGTGKQTVAK